MLKTIANKLKARVGIVLMSMLFLVPQISSANELVFSALDSFGSVNVYLAGLMVIIQHLIALLVFLGIIYDIMESVGQADFSKLISKTISAFIIIVLSTVAVRTIIKIAGLTSSSSTVSPSSYQALQDSFSILFKLIDGIQIGLIMVTLSSAVLFLLLTAMKSIGNPDIPQLIVSIITTLLFLLMFMSLVVKNRTTVNEKGEVVIKQNSIISGNLLLSATEINLDKNIVLPKIK